MATDRSSDSHRVEHVQRLFLRHAGLLRGFVLGLVIDPHLADDVFQELFITVTRKASDFRPGSNFLAWARAIGRLKVLEMRRAQKAHPQMLDPSALEAVLEVAGELDETWDRRRAALAHCLKRLAPRARQIVELRYSDDRLAPPAIAARLSWSTSAVYVALSRARKFLQQCTERRLGVQEV